MAIKKRSMNELRQVKEFKLKDQYNGKCRSGGLQNDNAKSISTPISIWIKGLRIVEVPLLLLIMAIGCIEEKAIITAIVLMIICIIRLAVNIITDSTIYKR